MQYAMYSPTARVLSVLELLQSRQQMSGKELAERLEVDQRTVRRYITMLQDMGIPVESKRGRYGMYYLRPGTKLPPLMFRNDEAFALTLGLLSARKLGLTVAAPAVESALAKIERALPLALREQVRAVHETLVFDFDLPKTAPLRETVVTLCVAVQQQRRVWLRYQQWNAEVSERECDSYGVVCRSGFWYTVGYCHLRKELRTFRLDRIIAVEMRDDTFVAPKAFDTLAHVERSLATMSTTWEIDVLLETTFEEAQRLISPAVGTLAQEQHGVALHCYAEHLEWMVQMLVSLCCPFLVRHPPELRAALLAFAQEIATMAERVPETV